MLTCLRDRPSPRFLRLTSSDTSAAEDERTGFTVILVVAYTDNIKKLSCRREVANSANGIVHG